MYVQSSLYEPTCCAGPERCETLIYHQLVDKQLFTCAALSKRIPQPISFENFVDSLCGHFFNGRPNLLWCLICYLCCVFVCKISWKRCQPIRPQSNHEKADTGVLRVFLPQTGYHIRDPQVTFSRWDPARRVNVRRGRAQGVVRSCLATELRRYVLCTG